MQMGTEREARFTEQEDRARGRSEVPYSDMKEPVRETPPIPRNLSILDSAFGDLKGACYNLFEQISPILGPDIMIAQMEGDNETSTISTSDVANTLDEMIRQINNLRTQVNGVRDRVEL